MNKKKVISIGIVVIMVTGMASWFLFLAEKKGKMEISQEKQQAEEDVQEQIIIEAPEENNLDSEKAGEKSPEQVVAQYKEEQKKPKETLIKPDEIIEKPVAEKKAFVLNIEDALMSAGFQKYSGERKVDTIVIHSSYNSLGGDQYDVDKIIAIYKSYGVSAHYIISRDGTAYRLVKDNDISYHAGVSKMPDGRTNANAFSIGIEIVGNKTDGYTDEQYRAVATLVDKIKKDYDIKYVLGHDDIAPERKTDPWGFQWERLK